MMFDIVALSLMLLAGFVFTLTETSKGSYFMQDRYCDVVSFLSDGHSHIRD